MSDNKTHATEEQKEIASKHTVGCNEDRCLGRGECGECNTIYAAILAAVVEATQEERESVYIASEDARGRDKREALLREDELTRQLDIEKKLLQIQVQITNGLLLIVDRQKEELAQMRRPLIPTEAHYQPTAKRCPQCDLVGACSCGGA